MRYVYNSVIADRQTMFEVGLHEEVEPAPTPTNPGRTRRSFDANRQAALITFERSRKPWLRDVSSVALIQSMRDAEQAFSNFFASTTGKRRGPKVGFPRFKSRFRGKQSARFTANGFKVDVIKQKVFIAKIGWIPLVLSRPLPSEPSSMTLTLHPDGTYECSFVVEVEETKITPATNRRAGIDLGLEAFASIVYLDGTREKIDNPRHLKLAQRKLAKAQKALSRKQGPDKRSKQKASNNWRKQQKKVSRIHSQVKNSRTDFGRKLAHRLAKENTQVSMESLNIRGLARSGGHNGQGKGLRRSVHDVGWGNFTKYLEEKMGDQLTLVNPAYTSQTCSVCQVIDGPKPLSIRVWECGNCGVVLDRDYNAAVNILVAAGWAETLNACGEDIRLRLSAATLDEARTHRYTKQMTQPGQQLCLASPRIPRL